MGTTLDILGNIVGGNLSSGLTMRLEPSVSPEKLKAGRLVVVTGELYTYFCIVADAELSTANRQVLGTTLEITENIYAQALSATHLNFDIELRPALVVPNSAEYDGKTLAEMMSAGLSPDNLELIREKIAPARSVPPHFSPVRTAGADDIAIVFGSEEEDAAHRIGEPMEMPGLPLCLDLDKITERSVALFGRTGTGKTYLALLLLAGILERDSASALIFDAHNDYGSTVSSEDTASGTRPGLRTLYGSKVRVYGLDKKSAENRGAKLDYPVEIPYSYIEPEDVLLLGELLGLSQAGADSLYLLQKTYGKKWLNAVFDYGAAVLAEESSANEMALGAVKRRLGFIERLGYLVPEAPDDYQALDEQVFNDIQKGRSVVVEFGNYQDLKSYLLVSNIITRRLHRRYVEATEASYGGGTAPRRLIIVVEEAHRFLSPDVARNTVFGTIAREMRKFGVTLMVVDQRPSAIYDEVMSQIGTRFVAALSDEKDLAAVTVGASGGTQLRNILSTLAGKRQALLFGHALPMPVVVKTRDYDELTEQIKGRKKGGKGKKFEERFG
ncbi:MAG: ATP-binding protein [bacterium]|nr:ATP-binding protein [bacterium]